MVSQKVTILFFIFQGALLLKDMSSSIKSLENPWLVPYLMNLKPGHEKTMTFVPQNVQREGVYIIDVTKLENKEDIYSDGCGAWSNNGTRTKYYRVTRNSSNDVTSIIKSSRNVCDVAVKRRYYACASYSNFRKTIISLELSSGPNIYTLLKYSFEGDEKQFDIKPHGNSKGSAKPFLRTKASTVDKLKETRRHTSCDKKAVKYVRDAVGGYIEAELSSLPRNERQLAYHRSKDNIREIDPIASVLELQKGQLKDFVREVSFSDLPCVVLFTQQQMDNIVKFCCHEREEYLSTLGADVTFNLGPFYLLVTTYQNMLLQRKSTGKPPVRLGPVLLSMCKDEDTYMTLFYKMLRAEPGVSEYLQRFGSDKEQALMNSLAIAFNNASSHGRGLLCYVHAKRNIVQELKDIGISKELSSVITHDIFGKPDGLVWLTSFEDIQEQAEIFCNKWETLEESERKGPSKFVPYFRKNKLDDIKFKMSAAASLKAGCTSAAPYSNNIPESINHLIKSWQGFQQHQLDQFVRDIAELIDTQEDEDVAAWLGISDDIEVRPEFKHLQSKQRYSNMSATDRNKEVSRVKRIKPDDKAYKECKFYAEKLNTRAPENISETRDETYSNVNLNKLTQFFTEAEVNDISERSKAILTNDGVRSGFEKSTYFVNGKAKNPHLVTLFRSGKSACNCSYHARNAICSHVVAASAINKSTDQLVSSFKTRNLTKISTSSAPSNVGSKAKPRKRKSDADEKSPKKMHCLEGTFDMESYAAHQIDETRLVFKRYSRPADPIPTAPLIVKPLSGAIRICQGCRKSIRDVILGFHIKLDDKYCFGRFEAYHFKDRHSGQFILTTGNRHYHLNPICIKEQQHKSLKVHNSTGNDKEE